MKTTNIGLFGYGVVGQGLCRILEYHPELPFNIAKICIRDIKKNREHPGYLFTDEPGDILEDSTIDIVVELIDDAEAAYQIASTALASGKPVVSANKKMLATNLKEVVTLQKQHDTPCLYEAAVCGSIPIMRNLEEYYVNDPLNEVQGIINGSTNYILSRMIREGLAYPDVLADAQEKGFAESDPFIDVEAFDAAYKMTIITYHAFGILIEPEKILRKGITALHPADIAFAKHSGKTLKLIAGTKRQNGNALHTYVMPRFVEATHNLARVNDEYNGVEVGSMYADLQFLSGKGAGKFPTALAVIGDLVALKEGYRYRYSKAECGIALIPDYQEELEVYIGFQTGKAVDESNFSSISARYSSSERSYIIGTISSGNLRTSEFWHDADVSCIAI